MQNMNAINLNSLQSIVYIPLVLAVKSLRALENEYKNIFYYVLKDSTVSLTIMSQLTENRDKIRTSVFKGTQSH